MNTLDSINRVLNELFPDGYILDLMPVENIEVEGKRVTVEDLGSDSTTLNPSTSAGLKIRDQNDTRLDNNMFALGSISFNLANKVHRNKTTFVYYLMLYINKLLNDFVDENGKVESNNIK